MQHNVYRWPERQCGRCRVARPSVGLVCPGPSLWRDRPRERADVRDVFILDTLASIDGMVFVRAAFELAAYRLTAGEKVLTVTQREPAPRM